MRILNEQELRDTFKDIFGFKPYDFQIRVAQNLLAGKSVVLQAPTGAGKTNTALFPYFYARQHLGAAEFPRKMIYSVERKILVNSFYSEVQKILAEKGLPLEATILTGDRPEDPEMRGNLIFTTIDQTLSSFLLVPYSLPSRIANLNAGAVNSSYLVFDEAHLFDPKTALPTLMWILKRLKGITPTLLMTATFSPPILNKLAKLTDGVVVQVEPHELKDIPAQANKKRFFEAVEVPLTAEAVISTHEKRSIVVCNTVDRAQQLYDDLEEQKKQKGLDFDLIMLHSRFWQADRKEIEEKLLKWFGKKKDSKGNLNLEVVQDGSAILIATQVIEVGVDITSEHLHTELAPANTILQRAGRCARHPDEDGTVHVYKVEKTLPYKESAELFDPTFEYIASFNEGGEQPVTFEMEQKLIDHVHTAKDELLLATIQAGRENHSQKIEQTINDFDHGFLSDLIRDTDSRTILVHDDPKGAIENPYEFEGFSVFDGSFKGALPKLHAWAAEKGETWAVKYPEYIEDKEDKQQIQRHEVKYEWKDLKPDDKVVQPLVVVNPALVRYDKQRGFRFGPGEAELCRSKKIDRVKKGFTSFDYERETYAEHIRNVNWAYGHFKFGDEIAFAVNRLQSRLGADVPANQIDRAIRLAFVFHDVGKLTQGWQTVTQLWQTEIGKADGSDIMLAHTDLNDALRPQQKIFEAKGNRRPPHAVEGSAIAARFLHDTLGKELYRPVVSAIARHHAPPAKQLSVFTLHKSAGKAIEEALEMIEVYQPWNFKPELLLKTISPGLKKIDEDRMLVKANSQTELLLFTLIIRVLRLADQNSFSYQKEHETLKGGTSVPK